MTKKTSIPKLAAIALVGAACALGAPATAFAQSTTFVCVASNGVRTFRGQVTAATPAGRPAARTRAILAARQLCGANIGAGNTCVMAGCRPY